MTRSTRLPLRSARGEWSGVIWFAALVASVCFEGLGRKFLPDVPSAFFYYFKDGVLLAGVGLFGLGKAPLGWARQFISGFTPVVAIALAWTFAEMFNPSHPSLLLGLIGLRSYWLWWLAPPLIATALRGANALRRATMVLTVVALIITSYAALQFASPADASINSYALFRGEQVLDVATVATTGRARVSSTFSYLTGFSDFVILLPPILLGFGIALRTRRGQVLSLVAAGTCLGVIPLSGSRGPLLLAMMGLVFLAVYSGLLRSRIGRRVTAGALLAGTLAYFSTPEAVQGLTDRFKGDDTQSRLREYGDLLPPIAIAVHDYPIFGEGTGTQQNARLAFGLTSAWATESETSRLLVEQGAIGYLLVWLTKVGLAVSLFRAAKRLKSAGNPGAAGAAVALGVFAFIGNSAFDHIWQALFFIGAGLVLANCVTSRSALPAARNPATARARRGVVQA